MRGLKTEPGMPQSLMPTMPGSSRGMPYNPGLMHPVAPTSDFVVAGVSNGEVLWSLPSPHPDSPENSSDAGSAAGPHHHHGGLGATSAAAAPMDNIDWVSLAPLSVSLLAFLILTDALSQDAINAIFPSDPQTGEVSFSTFVDPSIGMKWHR
jgi:hypothetical protein